MAPEHTVEKIVIGIGKVTIVIARRPECVIENVGIGIGPEHRAVPRHEGRAQAETPSPTWRQRNGARARILRPCGEMRGEAALLRRLRGNTRDAVTALAVLPRRRHSKAASPRVSPISNPRPRPSS